jgi:hypothetical protein
MRAQRFVGAVTLGLLTGLGVTAGSAEAAPVFDTVQTVTGTSGRYIAGVTQRVNARGDAVVGWIEETDQQRLKLAYRPAGGVFGVAAEFATTDRSGAFAIAIGASGEALAAWPHQGSEAATGVVIARTPGATGAWGTPRPVDLAGVDTRTPHVAIGAGGHAALLFSTPLRNPGAVVRVRPPGPGSAFGAPIAVAAVIPASGLTYLNADLLAVGPDGTVTTVLQQTNTVQAASLAAGATAFGPTQVLAESPANPPDSLLASSTADAAGNAFVAVRRTPYTGICNTAAECNARPSRVDGFYRPAGAASSFGPGTSVGASEPGRGFLRPFVDGTNVDIFHGRYANPSKVDADTLTLLDGTVTGPFTAAPLGSTDGDPTFAGAGGALAIARTAPSGVTVASRAAGETAFGSPRPTAAPVPDPGLAYLDLATADDGQLLVFTNKLSAPGFRIAYDGPAADTTAPQVFTGGSSRVAPTAPQRIGTDNEVDVPVACSEACTTTATGTASVGGGAAAVLQLGKRIVKLKVGERTTVGVPVPRAARTAIATALRRGRRVTARLRLRAADRRGNVRARSLSIRLTR